MVLRALLCALLSDRVGVDLLGGNSVVHKPRTCDLDRFAVVLSGRDGVDFGPVSLSPLPVLFTPPSIASRVRVRLVIGETPASAFGFAVLYFHVPSVLSAASAMAAMAIRPVFYKPINSGFGDD